MIKTLMGISIGALALAGCNAAAEPVDKAAIERQLRKNEQQWNRAYAQRDAAALAGMYAEDAALANPGANMAKGAAAIRKETEAYTKDPNLKVVFQASRIQVADSGDLAYTRGNYQLTMTDPKTKQPHNSTGYYLTVWQKQDDGSWKAVEDFVTPGAPPTIASHAQMTSF